jgi:hypothetical protein
MKRNEIGRLLKQSGKVDALAATFIIDVLGAENSPDSISQFIRYSKVEGMPYDFQVDLCHKMIIARFEYAKFALNNDYLAGQYVFYLQPHDESEVSLPFKLRLVGTEVMFGDVSVTIPRDGDQELLQDIKDELSRRLLEYVFEQMESFDNK